MTEIGASQSEERRKHTSAYGRRTTARERLRWVGSGRSAFPAYHLRSGPAAFGHHRSLMRLIRMPVSGPCEGLLWVTLSPPPETRGTSACPPPEPRSGQTTNGQTRPAALRPFRPLSCLSRLLRNRNYSSSACGSQLRHELTSGRLRSNRRF